MTCPSGSAEMMEGFRDVPRPEGLVVGPVWNRRSAASSSRGNSPGGDEKRRGGCCVAAATPRRDHGHVAVLGRGQAFVLEPPAKPGPYVARRRVLGPERCHYGVRLVGERLRKGLFRAGGPLLIPARPRGGIGEPCPVLHLQRLSRSMSTTPGVRVYGQKAPAGVVLPGAGPAL